MQLTSLPFQFPDKRHPIKEKHQTKQNPKAVSLFNLASLFRFEIHLHFQMQIKFTLRVNEPQFFEETSQGGAARVGNTL